MTKERRKTRKDKVAVGMPVTRHPRSDPYVRDYLIRLLPQVRHVRVPKGKDDRCEQVETKPQSDAPFASRAGCVFGSDALTLSTIPFEARAGMGEKDKGSALDRGQIVRQDDV